MINMCRFYNVSSYPALRPLCQKGRYQVGLACHSEREWCPDYEPTPKQTVVVNIKDSSCDQLIDRTTIFGNPFPVWKYGRDGCIKKFETYFYERIERDLEWRAKVLELDGKILGCHCKPLDCHGDIYVEWLNTHRWLVELGLETK